MKSTSDVEELCLLITVIEKNIENNIIRQWTIETIMKKYGSAVIEKMMECTAPCS